jgi:hypothetical protein
VRLTWNELNELLEEQIQILNTEHSALRQRAIIKFNIKISSESDL